MLFRIFKKIRSFLIKLGVVNNSIVNSLGRRILIKLKPKYVVVDGNTIFLDHEDKLNLSVNKYHEENETVQIKKQIFDGNVVVDIGASIGYYTVLFAKIVGEKGQVFAFEPEHENFNILKKNIEVNNFKNVVIENIAISDKIGHLPLKVEKDGSHKIIYDDSKENMYEIKSTTLDEYFKQFDNKIDFIKMDAEGSEYFILQGMKKILEKQSDLKIMTEFNPPFLRQAGIEPEKYIKKLLENGFLLYDLRKKQGECIPTNLNEIVKDLSKEPTRVTDLLCIFNKD